MGALKRRNKSISIIFYIVYVLLLLILIGDVIGAMLYLKLDETSTHELFKYVHENVQVFNQKDWSFNEIFYEQFMYQGSIWLFGLTIVGVVINLFLIFLKGVIAGFNLLFIFESLPFFTALWTAVIWFIQYGLILAFTLISGYFSIRFVVVTVRILVVKKEPKLLKTHLLYYFYQLVIVMLLTLLSTSVTYVMQPLTYEQFNQSLESDEAKEETPQENTDVSDKNGQNDTEFDGVVL